MTDIVEFLLARLDEAEKASHGYWERWHRLDCATSLDGAAECDCAVPEWMRCDIWAKRRIISEFSPRLRLNSDFDALFDALVWPYSYHPDFQPEWAPARTVTRKEQV